MSKTSRGQGLTNRSIHDKSPTVTQLKLKSLYTQLVAQHSQRNRPFGNAEERFIAQPRNKPNNFFNGNDIKYFQITRRKRQDNLEGGIGFFESSINKTISRLTKRPPGKELSNQSGISTHRVIQPDFDRTKQKAMHKRQCVSSANSANGSLASLFEKTPLSDSVKGKKCINYTVNRSNSTGKDWKPCIRQFTQRSSLSLTSQPLKRGKKHF